MSEPCLLAWPSSAALTAALVYLHLPVLFIPSAPGYCQAPASALSLAKRDPTNNNLSLGCYPLPPGSILAPFLVSRISGVALLVALVSSHIPKLRTPMISVACWAPAYPPPSPDQLWYHEKAFLLGCFRSPGGAYHCNACWRVSLVPPWWQHRFTRTYWSYGRL